MEMDELNKSQIVLLTLLVSFVTSLATGIATVSLMEQGITPVTNTVNQIVERTKEVIVRVQEPQDKLVITEKETVVVSQSDLVAEAVSKNKNSSIILYQILPAEEVVEDTLEPSIEPESLVGEPETVEDGTKEMLASSTVALDSAAQAKQKLVFASRAVVLTGGVIVADASNVNNDAEYGLLNSNKEVVKANILGTYSGIVILQAEAGTAATLGDTSTIERGQAVIMLSGTGRLRVTTTIISDILLRDGNVYSIETDKGTDTPGSVLINIKGELIGISTGVSRVDGSSWFAPSSTIEAALNSGDNADI